MSTPETRALPAVAVEIMESLYQHRLLSTRQIQAMHAPDTSPQWLRRVLADLASRGLVAVAAERQPRGRPMYLHYLTERGSETVEMAPQLEERKVLVSPEGAAGQLQAHTLAVNDVGIAFLEAARERGDEFGSLAWRHEVAHQIGPGIGRKRGGDWVVADAMLKYLSIADGQVSLVYRFLELDRGTMPVDDVVAKFNRYARLVRYVPEWKDGTEPGTPLWRRVYPTFPAILVVFASKSRELLERRMKTIQALALADEQLRGEAGPEIFFCLLDALQALGPYEPIFRRLSAPMAAVDWLGEPAHSDDRKRAVAAA